MEKHVFLDTNVLQQCKLFTEIDWENLFEDNPEKITIHIPNMVLRELDKNKKESKKARQVIPLLRKFIEKEFRPKVYLDLSIFPTKWDSLKDEWKEKLDINDPDHHIIGEILFYKENNADKDVWFITGDNTPSLVSEKMKISTIFWRDDEYISKFQIAKAKPRKYPELLLCFENAQKSIDLSKTKPPKQIVYIPPKNPEDPSKDLLQSSMFSLSNMLVQTESGYKEEVESYNKEIEKYKDYHKIIFYLLNTAKHPYNDIDISFKTTLEKGYDIKYSINLIDLPKPSRDSNIFNTFSPIPRNMEPPNVRYSAIQKRGAEKNDIWYLGYHVQRIKHNQPIKLYSIMIKLPDNFKAKVIVFKCTFTHEEEGTVKPQSLVIHLDT